MFIDSHAHLESDVFDNDIREVYGRASENSVGRIINVGYNQISCEKTIQIIKNFDNIWGVCGMHPHDASSYNIKFEQNLFNWLADKKVLALGEIGLDYFKEYSPGNIQREVFIRQLEIAGELNIPVVIHCRDAYDDCYRIMKEMNVSNGVMHCFSGNQFEAERFLELGLYISFTGTVTFRKSDVRPIEVVPIERLLLETDCPYMTPVPNRGKRNEPSYIPLIAAKIAEIKNISLEDIEKITTENVFRLFKGLK